MGSILVFFRHNHGVKEEHALKCVYMCFQSFIVDLKISLSEL